MSSKVSSGRNHNHSDSKQSGQQAPGSTPPAARSEQAERDRQSQKGGSGSKQSGTKGDKS